MTYPLPLFNRRVYRYQSAFIDLPANEQTSKYLQSKFLRIWSGFGYSAGRFLEIQDFAEYVEIIEIFDIENRMEMIFREWEWLFIALREHPEMRAKFVLEFK